MTIEHRKVDLAEARLAQAKKEAETRDRILADFVEDTLYCMRRFIKSGYTEATAVELTDLTLGRRDDVYEC